MTYSREQRNALRMVKLYKSRVRDLEERKAEIAQMSKIAQMIHKNELKNINETIVHFNQQIKKYRVATF